MSFHVPYPYSLESLDVSKQHAKILRDIDYLCQELMLTWPIDPTPAYCSDVLNRFMYLPIPVEEGPLVANISDGCRIAAVILCFLPFRNDYPSPALMFNVQLHKLIRVLEVVLELASPGHLILPWLLMVGGIYATKPERDWL